MLREVFREAHRVRSAVSSPAASGAARRKAVPASSSAETLRSTKPSATRPAVRYALQTARNQQTLPTSRSPAAQIAQVCTAPLTNVVAGQERAERRGCARHRGPVPITLSEQEQYAAAFPNADSERPLPPLLRLLAARRSSSKAFLVPWRSISLGIADRAHRPEAGPVRVPIVATGRTCALGPAVGNDILCTLTWSAALTMVYAAACRFACISR